MSRPALKIVPFPVQTETLNNPIRPVLTVVPARPLLNSAPPKGSAIRRQGGYALAIAATIALHGLWLSNAIYRDAEPPAQKPTVLTVSWLPAPVAQIADSPKPDVKKPPKPQSKPKALTKTPPKPLAKPAKNLIASRQANRSVAEASLLPTLPRFEPKPVSTTTQAAPSSAPAAPAAAEPISLPHLNADYLHNPAPDYPPESRELGEQGRVLVRAKISTDGKVEQVMLRKSSGFQRLDEAALSSVKQWRFVPAQQSEVQVAAWVVVPVAFYLEG